MPEVQPSAHTFVVHGRRGAARTASQFRDHAGRQITLVLRRARRAQGEERAVFFTRSWLYGHTLAVIEVGRMPKDG